MLDRLLCVAVGCILSSVAFAQGTAPSTAPSNPTILQGIQQLQQNDVVQSETLQAILKALQGLTPPPGPTDLTTPPLSGDTNQFVACQVANVGSTPANITITMIGHLGQTQATRQATLPPLNSFGIGIAGDRSQSWCHFTADVPVSQLRADIVVFTGTEMTAAVSAR